MHTCLYEPRMRASSAGAALSAAAASRVAARQASFSALAGRLNALSPLATLERGYSVARGANGATLASVSGFTPGRPFTLRLSDGEVDATTRATRPLPEPTR
jgi:exodeoxyribonuclease VII large subunit